MSIQEREEIEQEYKWDVENVYNNIEEWEEEFEQAGNLVEKMEGLAGEIKDAEQLLEILENYEKLNRKTGKLSRYAKMRSDEDTRSQEFQELLSRSKNLSSRASKASSFLEPAIQAIEREELESMMEKKESLEMYEHYFDDVMRSKPHTRSDEIEDVLANLGEVLSGPYDAFSKLSNADMEFPEVETPEGETIRISSSNFTKLMKKEDRDFRKQVYQEFYSRLSEFRNTFGSTLENRVKTDAKIAQIRNFDSSREAALHSAKIPGEVYDNLVETVEDNLDLLHRHLELKKTALGVEDLEMWDVYMPIADSESPDVGFEEAKEHVIEAVAPLGEEYQEKMREGLESGWVDVYENKGKRSGAYSGGSYDTKPFILMNFQNDISSMYTLAHELGHSMHSHFTNSEQPYIYSNYDIFVAEVASTVNEALLTRHLLETVEDEEFRRHVLSHYLENFRGTIYRQTMFADFEHAIHTEVESGGALTPDKLDKEYGERKESFYDPANLDNSIRQEWMRIPHFYYNYYVYQYATGMSAAVALSKNILEGGADDYIDFLKSGSSKYPIKALEDAGVDMSSPEPVEKALKVYERHLEKMEDLVN